MFILTPNHITIHAYIQAHQQYKESGFSLSMIFACLLLLLPQDSYPYLNKSTQIEPTKPKTNVVVYTWNGNAIIIQPFLIHIHLLLLMYIPPQQ